MKHITKRNILAFLTTFVLLASFTLPITATALERQADSSILETAEPVASEAETTTYTSVAVEDMSSLADDSVVSLAPESEVDEGDEPEDGSAVSLAPESEVDKEDEPADSSVASLAPESEKDEEAAAEDSTAPSLAPESEVVQVDEPEDSDASSLPEESKPAGKASEPLATPAQIAGVWGDFPSFAPMSFPADLPDPVKFEDIFPDPALCAEVYTVFGVGHPGYSLSDYSYNEQQRWDAILSDLNSINSLSMQGPVTDLTGIEYLTSLEYLTFVGGNTFDSMEPLDGLSLIDLTIPANSKLETLSGLTSSGSTLTNLQISDCSKLEDISGLSVLSGLVNLNITNCPAVNDISSLAGLSTLTNVDLSGCSVSDITPLEDSLAVNLDFLNLQGNQVADISSLENNSSLWDLNLADNQLSGKVTLKNMSNLSILDLQNNAITEIDDLSGFTSLTTLRLRNNRLTSVAMLNNLPDTNRKSLISESNELDLSNNQLVNCDGLAGWSLSGGGTLYLNNNQIKNIEGLSGIVLNELILDDNPLVTLPTTASFYSAIDMYNLSIQRTEIADISPLAGISNLWNLYASDCTNLELSSMAGFSALEILDVSGTNVAAGLANLSGCSNLRQLFMADNGIETEQFGKLLDVASTLTNLNYLDIQNNNIMISPAFFTRASAFPEYNWMQILYDGNPVSGDPLEFIEWGRQYPVLSLSGLDLGELSDAEWQNVLLALLDTGYIERLRLANCNLNDARLNDLVDTLLVDRSWPSSALMFHLTELDLSGNDEIGPFEYTPLPTGTINWNAQIGTILTDASGSLDKLCKALLGYRHINSSQYREFTLKLAGCTGATPQDLGSVQDIINTPTQFSTFELDMSGCGLTDATPYALSTEPSSGGWSVTFLLNLDGNSIPDVSMLDSMVKDDMGWDTAVCVVSAKNQTIHRGKSAIAGTTLKLENPILGLGELSIEPNGNFTPADGFYVGLTNEVHWSNLTPPSGVTSYEFDKTYLFRAKDNSNFPYNVEALIFSGTVVAEYEQITHTVSYDGNGADSTSPALPAVARYAENALVPITTTTPTRQGYTFAGWLNDNDSQIYWAAPATPNQFTMPGKNVKLTAQWTPLDTKYTVTYDGNGSTGGTVPAQASYSPGTTVGIAAGVPTRTNYIFAGWLNNQNNQIYWAAPATPNQFTMPGKNVKLTAQWTPVDASTFTVTYHANNGTKLTVEDPARYATGSSYTAFAADTFSYKGYHFVRWDTRATANGEGVQPGASRVMGSKNENLYAIWEKDKVISSEVPPTPSSSQPEEASSGPRPTSDGGGNASSGKTETPSTSTGGGTGSTGGGTDSTGGGTGSTGGARSTGGSGGNGGGTPPPTGGGASGTTPASSRPVSSATAAGSSSLVVSSVVSSQTASEEPSSSAPDDPAATPDDATPPDDGPAGGDGEGEADSDGAYGPVLSIGGRTIPLYSSEDVWSLVNLILTVAGLLTAVLVLVGIFRRRSNPAGEDTQAGEDTGDERETTNARQGLKIGAILLGVLSPILFLVLESLRNSMTLFDKWSWLFVVLLLAECVLAALSRRRLVATNADEEEAAGQG